MHDERTFSAPLLSRPSLDVIFGHVHSIPFPACVLEVRHVTCNTKLVAKNGCLPIAGLIMSYLSISTGHVHQP
jgi:hypothetical protein